MNTFHTVCLLNAKMFDFFQLVILVKYFDTPQKKSVATP